MASVDRWLTRIKARGDHVISYDSQPKDDQNVFYGVVQSIKPSKGTIGYKDGSQYFVVPFDVTTQLTASCCHGDPVSFCLTVDNNGRHKASHVIPSSHVIPIANKLLGTIKCTKGHGVIFQHDTEQYVQFDCDDINDDKYLHEGACVQFLLDDKLATNITPFPEAGPYLGVITKVANQKENGKLLSEILGGGFREFSYHSSKNTPTLLLGDVVTFYHFGKGSHVAHVTLHTLIEQLNNGMHRHKGKITKVDIDGYYGYINYDDNDVPFYGYEIINEGWAPIVGEEVLFSLTDEVAIRVAHSSPSSLHNDWIDGIVRDGNMISYLSNNDERTIAISQDHMIQVGDHVSFRIISGAAYNIIVGGAGNLENVTTSRGLVATLRDGFGFIECEDRSREVFFSFSACHSDINPHTLQLLDEVEFQLVTKSGKTSASDVRLLPTGTISHEQIVGTDYHDGLVLRPMKSLDKKGYYEGVIQSCSNPDQQYTYSITSLADPLIALQAGDNVQFKVGLLAGQQRAVQVISCRQFINGSIESLKSKERYGFISYKDEEGMSRSVFFHMSNVEHGDEVAIGDQVKFQLSFSQRAQKHSASHVSRIQGNSSKPGWLIRRGSTNSLPSLEFCIIRQPHGPSGRGFNQ